MILVVFLFLVLRVELGVAKVHFGDRPRITVKEGHLIFKASPYKNISFETTGVTINNIDLLTTLNKAHAATQLTDDYYRSLSTYSDRLDAIEERLHGSRIPPISNMSLPFNATNDAQLRLLRRLRARVTALERWSNSVKTLLTDDPCQSSPCKNGASCLNLVVRYHCFCREGWEGKDCSENINECARFVGTDLGCQNGAICTDKPGTYECTCQPGWVGIHCTRRKVDCLSGGTELCGHGTCISTPTSTGYKCICDQGWTNDGTNPACTFDVDECKQNHPSCSVNPKVECINVPGSYYCGTCPQGYSGNGYTCSDIDECEKNNGNCNPMVECRNIPGSRICGPCPPGYSGDGTTCSFVGVCNVNNGGCHPIATCRDNSKIGSSLVDCTCPLGYIGSGIGPSGCLPGSNIDSKVCVPNPCNHGICTATSNGYTCTCNSGYTGHHCDVQKDFCNPNPCQNDGVCQNLAVTFKCVCTNGFTGALCSLQQSACGGLFKNDNGVIKYPLDSTKNYGQSSNCAWTIMTNDTTKVLTVTFKKFDLENSTDCQNDFLEIHDGRNTASPMLGTRFCGNQKPLGGNFTSTHNVVYIWFRSDNRVEKAGFEIMWNMTDWKCGGVLSESHGIIQSPGAPGNYPTARDCWWRLSTSPGKRYLFTFYYLNIGDNKDCGLDLIQFFTQLDYMRDNDKFRRICNSTKPEPFYSPGNTVMIHFHSNKKDTYPGFQMSYSVVEAVPGCGGVYTSASGHLYPPREVDSNGIAYTSCEYEIQQPQNSKIKLIFEKFDLPVDRCDVTYVEVFEGSDTSAPSVGRYCGNVIPPSYTSIGNYLTILYELVNGDYDWKIKYERACAETFTNESGKFSPSAFYSQSGHECIYKIERPSGDIIELILKVSMMRFGIYRTSFGFVPQQCVSGGYIEVKDGDHPTSTVIGKYCATTTVNVTSSQNVLVIKLKLGTYYGTRDITDSFSAEYTSYHSGCGGILRKKFDHISSPSHVEEGYPPDKNCKWIIMAPPNNIIKLSWQTFSIESSYECSYDNIQIFDNNTELGKGELMGKKYCGSTLPPDLFSSSNIMTIIFHTDSSINTGGFLASYTFLKDSEICNINYGSSTGVIKSPGYPSIYPTNKECTYTITVQSGRQIMLNITEFSLEAYPGCKYDWLEIRNGGSSTSPLIGKYCGTTIPKTIVSHTNQIYLYFKSDISRGSTGFRILWSSAATGCGGTLISPVGSISSPHYPEPYNRNTECSWKVVVNSGSKILAVFSDINLEKHVTCMADYVELFDGLTLNSNSLGKFCNEIKTPIQTTGNKMLVKFRSDINFQGRGFQLHYSTACHNTITGFRGVIESPNFPYEYPQDEDCLWEIVVANKNKINITFSHFEIERAPTFANNSCIFDYVEIYYGLLNEDMSDEYIYTKYGRYCGHENPGSISLDSDHVRIQFVSDKLLLGSGFRLEWLMWGCGGHLTHNSGTIKSPNYPQPYPPSVACEWLIEVEFGKSIKIEFLTIDVETGDECDFDHIKLYNGPNNSSNILTTLCRQKKSSVISSTGNFLFMVFSADFSYQGKGFIANYSTIPTKCGGVQTASEGSIFSPNYPKNFDRNDSCAWLIEVDDGHTIDLTFKEVDIYETINCSKNYVKVHDGPTSAYPVLKTVCGKEAPNDTIKSSYNFLYVEFQSWVFTTTKGFLASYKKSCGSRIETESNGIINFAYNEFGGYTLSCQWTIVAKDPSKHVSLIITQLQGMGYCEAYDYSEKPIRVYNGETAEAPLLASYCDSKIPPPLVSDGSALSIQIDSSQISFTASYSIYDSHCGGTLVSEEGYFATPGYPKTYPSDIQCEWTIQISPGNHVSLSFLKFDLPTSDNCNTDYLEIRSQNASGRLLGVYCGSEPANITNVGALWLMFKSSKIEGSTSSKGFKAEFAMSKENELKGRTGVICSPLYPQEYTGTSEYSWKITVAMRSRVLISFKEFDVDALDNNGDCYFATLEFFDGVDNTATSLGSFCGGNPPEPINSTSNIMFIQASFSGPRLGSKFKLEWMETRTTVTPFINIKNTSCGYEDIISLNSTPYKLTSPGFPEGYKNNLQCTWIFSTPPTDHVQIIFSSLKLDRTTIIARTCDMFDRVKIYKREGNDGWKLLREVCQQETVINGSIESNNFMKVEFITNSFLNGTGFKAFVYSSCGGTLTDSSGYIVSSNTTRIFECQWNITVRATRRIELNFEEMNIARDANNICSSFILVRNGQFPESPLVGKYCGSQLPEKLKSSSNNLYIKYSGQGSKDTFRLRYREVSESCGGEVVLTTIDNATEIMSPNYPNIPQAHIECIWVIRGPPDETVKIEFEDRFDLTVKKNCEIDYVELRDGGTEHSQLIGRYCKSAPSTQTSTSNIMYVKFFTDTDDPRDGFKAKVSLTYCGGTYRGSSGDISLSNLPSTIKDFNCSWHIVGLRDHYLIITFTQLNTACSYGQGNYNYVTITEVSEDNENVTTLGRQCGSTLPTKNITTSGNEAFISYNGINTGTFKLNFKASQTECGESLFTDTGEIMSPGYPVMNHFNRRCLWKIQVSQGRRIKLEIVDLDFNIASYEQVLAVYDGDNFKVQLALIRTTFGKKFIESSSNKLTVRFWSKELSTHRGFKLKYTSDEPTLCIGDFSQQTGVITNPPSCNTTYSCEWVRNTNTLLKQTLVMTVTLETSVRTHACLSLPELIIFGQDNNILNKICSTTAQPVIVRSPFIRTTIQARAGILVSMNFSINYQLHDCGGIVNTQNGTIQSPTYSVTPQAIECAWLIEVHEGQRINLTTVYMNLGQDCEKNFLTVHNGDSPSHPRIGKFCKNNKPEPIVSQSKYLWIEYKWAKGSTGSGIQLTYEALDEGCGGILTDRSRIIESPNYGNQYPNNAECIWEVHAKEGYMIHLWFIDRFFIEQSQDCVNDYLEIFDWKDENWVSFGKKCGRDAPNLVKSTSNKLMIRFRSNDKITGGGFKAMWMWHCGGTFEASRIPHYIISPGYPNFYENSITCTYTIKPKYSQIFKIEFLDFDIEGDLPSCEFDNVTISDAYNKRNSRIYCENKKPPITRSRNSMEISFKTDSLLVKKGFKFLYVDETCGGNITITETVIEVTKSQFIVPYNTYNTRNPYGTRINCIWNVMAPPDKMVVLSIINLEMTSLRACAAESLSIYKDYNPILANRLSQICSYAEHVMIKSDTGKMLLKLDAYPATFKNFKALVTFSYGPSQGCGGIINLVETEAKYIQSPNLRDLNCAWKIVAPMDYKVQIQFTELNLPEQCANSTNSSACECAYIEIRDGNSPFSELIEKLCPNSTLSHDYRTFTTSWNRGFLYLFLKGKKENAFKATLKTQLSVCGHSVLNVTKQVQTLTTPNYPNSYPSNTRCSYLFSASVDQIRLHFVDFELTEETLPNNGNQYFTCLGDKIQIYEDPTRRNTISDDSLGPATVYSGRTNRNLYSSFDSNVDRHIFCGKDDKPFDYYSSGRTITLSLDSTDNKSKGKGFKLEYSTVGCTRNYSETNARVLSGTDKSDCIMTITVPEGRTISLYFYRFICQYGSSFEVRDQSPTGKQLIKTCGNAIIRPVHSLTNQLYIKVHNTGTTPAIRYEFMYTSTEDGAGCGGELYSYRGKFYSPMYPSPFRNDTICTWIIKVPVGLHSVLKFTIFDIQGNCDNTYVEIVTQPYDSTKKFCQGDRPGLIRSESSISVRFVSSIHNGGVGWIAMYRGINKDIKDIAATAMIF